MNASRFLMILGLYSGFALNSLPARADEPGGDRYALLIGVSKYDPKELRGLKYPESDVNALAKVLVDAGYPADNVVRMTLESGANAPRYLPDGKRIRQELTQFLKAKTDKDVVIVAFAGHGVSFKDDPESYFCPQDAKLSERETLLSLGEVYRQLAGCEAGMKVLLVDACRNDPQSDASRDSGPELKSVSMPQLPKPPGGVAAFFSCSAGEKAFEHDDIQHGVFFHFLIEGLRGAAVKEGNAVSLDDLRPYVKKRVNDFVYLKYGWRQTPEDVGQIRGTVPLITWKKSPPPVKAGTESAVVDLATAPSYASPAGEFQSELFTAKQQKVRRVTTFHRLTDNKLADKRAREPIVAKISPDGSKIVYFSPQSGLWTISSDGSDPKQILPELPQKKWINPQHLLLSPNGKTVYYQPHDHGISRINADGTDPRPLSLKPSALPLRLRENGNRLYFGDTAGIYSVDTAGNGDLRTVVSAADLGTFLDDRFFLMNTFDVNETGTRVAFTAIQHGKKLKKIFGVNTDGTGLRTLAELDFEPHFPVMKPDGSELIFWKGLGDPHYLDWRTGEVRTMKVPGLLWDGNTYGNADWTTRFSWDGRWLTYRHAGGLSITRADGTDRFEPLGVPAFDGVKESVFHIPGLVDFSSDLRKFVYIANDSDYAGRPRQLVVGEFGTGAADGLPKITDVEFPARLSTSADVPNHVGQLKAKIVAGKNPVRQVSFCLSPAALPIVEKPDGGFDFERGIAGLQRDGRAGFSLLDDGQSNDGAAADNLFGAKLIPLAHRPPKGKLLVRLTAHTDREAVIVDVEGTDIR